MAGLAPCAKRALFVPPTMRGDQDQASEDLPKETDCVLLNGLDWSAITFRLKFLLDLQSAQDI